MHDDRARRFFIYYFLNLQPSFFVPAVYNINPLPHTRQTTIMRIIIIRVVVAREWFCETIVSLLKLKWGSAWVGTYTE